VDIGDAIVSELALDGGEVITKKVENLFAGSCCQAVHD
jgi:hypothetical protein